MSSCRRRKWFVNSADIGIALDGLEEEAVRLEILGICGEVPGIYEGFCRDFFAIRELRTLLYLDCPVLGVGGFDGLCQGIDCLAIGVIGTKTFEEQLDYVCTVRLIGVSRQQRVLGFIVVCGDDFVWIAAGLAGSVVATGAAAATGHCEGDYRRYA